MQDFAAESSFNESGATAPDGDQQKEARPSRGRKLSALYAY